MSSLFLEPSASTKTVMLNQCLIFASTLMNKLSGRLKNYLYYIENRALFDLLQCSSVTLPGCRRLEENAHGTRNNIEGFFLKKNPQETRQFSTEQASIRVCQTHKLSHISRKYTILADLISVANKSLSSTLRKVFTIS